MSTDAKIAAYGRDYVRHAAATLERWLTHACESPIEQLLLACLFSRGWGPNENPWRNWSSLHQDVARWGFKPTPWLLGAEYAACLCAVQLPVKLGPTLYRVDFAFLGEDESGAPARYAVELDGHDFHERTKEQASKDRKRDRAFVANGWTVLRYTGADVYRDPDAIVSEVQLLSNKRCWPWMEEDT